MMTAGAWQVRVAVEGALGSGVVSVPVPTLPQATLDMSLPLRALLFALMVLLGAGFVSIVAASAAKPGWSPARRRARAPPSRQDCRRHRDDRRGRDCRARQLVVDSRSIELRAIRVQAARSVNLGGARWTLDAGVARSRMDCHATDGRSGSRSRPPDAPLHRVAVARSPVASPSNRIGTPRSNSGSRTSRRASTTCLRTSCTRAASRRR